MKRHPMFAIIAAAAVVIVLGAIGDGSALADENVPTTTDQAQAALAEAQAEIVFERTTPPPVERGWLATTDQVRAAVGRAQYRTAIIQSEPRPEERILVTTSDTAREAIRRPRRQL